RVRACQVQFAAAQKPQYESARANFRELDRRPAQFGEFRVTADFESWVLAQHHAQGNRNRRPNLPDKIDGWGESTHVEITDNLEPAGASRLRRDGVRHRASDDFKKTR